MEAYERRTGFYGIGRFFEELGIIRLVDKDSIKKAGSPGSDHMLGGTSSQGSKQSISTELQKDFSFRKGAAHDSVWTVPEPGDENHRTMAGAHLHQETKGSLQP